MDTTITQQNTESAQAAVPAAPRQAAGAPAFGDRRNDPRSRGPRRGPARETKERVKPEFDTKIIAIRRVTRVASGGRRFSFSVAVVSGDRKGRVGVGLGKAVDTSIAIDKATRDAKKNMVKVALTPQMTIPHSIEAKFSSSRVMMTPARGRGVVAGSSVRTIIELAGIKDISAKIFSGSKNKINNARAALAAFETISKQPRHILKGKPAKVAAK